MSDFFPADLGSLRVDTIYDYYDGPVLFVARNEQEAFLVVAANDDGEATDYLYVGITQQRLAQVDAGQVSLREAFGQPENGAAIIVRVPDAQKGETTSRTIATAEIPEEWLPASGQFVSPGVAASDASA